ncbi:MAG: type II secretion system protein GspL [Gammaproteobacteria bacterium]
MQRLIITWDPKQEACDWLLLDHNGNREGSIHRAQLLDTLPQDGATELVWIFPGVQAVAVSTQLPVRGRDKILRALPFALEESFAAEPDALFFALASTAESDRQQAVAVKRTLLGEGIEQLAAHGLQARRVVPDYLTLPWTPGQWSVLADAGMLYVRHGEAGGFAIEAELGWDLLVQRLDALGEDAAPHSVRYLRGREPWGPEPELELLQPDPEPYTEGLLGIAPLGFAAPPVLDLRQGEYSLHKDWMPRIKPWMPAAGALGVVIVLALAGFAASWYQAAQTRNELAKKIHARFVQVLPHSGWQDESTAHDVIEGLLRNRAQGHSGSGFMDLLSAVSAAHTTQSVSIKSLTYQPGQLQLQVHATTVTALNKVSTQLEQHAVDAKVNSANQTASGVDGSLMIRAGGGGT